MPLEGSALDGLTNSPPSVHRLSEAHRKIMADPAVFSVDQLGIKDIDGYSHVWYGNYLKFFERGAQRFLGGGRVVRVGHLKYKRSVPWGANSSRIESYLVSCAAGRALVFQRWCVGHDADSTFATCLSELSVEGCARLPAVMEPKARLLAGAAGGREPMLAVAGKNLESSGVPPISAAEGIVGRMVVPRHVFADMVAESGKMQIVDAMDLFEQSRTETVGGQQGLKAFLDRGLALVVGQIDELVLAEGVALGASVNVRCEVTLIRETTERRCFHFQQRLLRADGAEVARVRVLMCCVDQSAGALARVPDESWEEWKRIMGELEAGGVGSVAITPATAAAM